MLPNIFFQFLCFNIGVNNFFAFYFRQLQAFQNVHRRLTVFIGGRCVLQGRLDRYQCDCTFGWTDRHCESVDNCANDPCSNGATCISNADGNIYIVL